MATGISPDLNHTRNRDPWTPRTTHDNNHHPEPTSSYTQANGHSTPSTSPATSTSTSTSNPPAPITLRAFLLGLTLGLTTLLTLTLALHPTPLWRLPFFISALSLFHYLEFQTTALYNPTSATVSAFLLSQNGKAYNIAHTLAFTECAVRWSFFPNSQIIPGGRLQTSCLILGFVMMVVGQSVRTIAMAQAGENFSHVLRDKKTQGHVLVTGGIYTWLRHPSYFGFFWWGLGSQVVLGNWVCLLGYAVVLRRFFRLRIHREENYLIGFFGTDYVRYRDKTGVWIPFI